MTRRLLILTGGALACGDAPARSLGAWDTDSIVAPAHLPEGGVFIADGPDRLTVRVAGGSEATLTGAELQVRLGEDTLGLRTIAYSGDPLPAAQPALAACAPFQAECRSAARLDHDGLTEWWTTTAGGLQQGWILTDPVDRATVTLVVHTTRGALRSIDPDGQGATFAGDRGGTWRYAGLKAWDAAGEAVSAQLEPAESGVAVVVHTAGARWPITVDPIVSAPSVITASDAVEYAGLGRTLAAPGDIDGDGYADLAVGVYAATDPQFYVYYGSSSGIESDSEQIVQTTDSVSGDNLATGMLTGGDFDSDGFADVAVGATGDDDAGINAGAAYVFYGSATGLVEASETKLTASSAANYTYLGAHAGVGDLDGDGFDDLVVGTHKSYNKEVFAYYGSVSGLLAASEQTIASPVDSASSSYGSQVAAGGDLDGDGFDDLVVGAERDDGTDSSEGSVYVYLGSTTGVDLGSEQRVAAPAPASFDYFGAALSTGGDLNGDGYADLVIGASGNDQNGSGAGSAYIVYGSSTGLQAASTVTLTPADASAGARFGDAVAIVPDLDDDGFDDLVVGATQDDEVGSFAGAAYVYQGAASGISTGSEDKLLPSTAGSFFGYAVAGLGDMDGDGAGELAVGATSDDRIVSGGGAVYLYDGICDVDADGDGACASVDCDDTDASARPGGSEVPGDSVDGDCDGLELCYADVDGDGYTDGTTVVSADLDCAGTGEATDTAPDGDCDDTDATAFPGATETAGDGVDSDCDGTEVCYADADADGYTDGTTVASPDVDCTGTGEATDTTPDGDCDDADSTRSPSASEGVGDAIDQDCDGTEICYADADADGYHDGASTVVSADLDCLDVGEARDDDPSGDCDDTDGSVHPGAPETTGDGIDQDCDGTELCFVDADDDGFTNGLARVVSTDTDCDDPGEGTWTDPTTECDDTDATVFPGATEGIDDGVDQDCDDTELCYADRDGDGYTDGSTVPSTDLDCTDAAEARATAPTGDCDDTDPARHPASRELAGDGVDSDCDGIELCFVDADGDGHTDGASTVSSGGVACDAPGQATADAPTGDCDDTDGTVHPATTEAIGDGVDSDCDGTELCFVDADGDGAAHPTDTLRSLDSDCTDPGEATDAASLDDCDDTDAQVVPGATELPGDGVDSDCNGSELCFEDGDGDGYIDGLTTIRSEDADCADPGEALRTAARGECDDTRADVNPAQPEVADDGIDNDCDGTDDTTADGEADTPSADKSTGCATGTADRSLGGLALGLAALLGLRRRRAPSFTDRSR